MYNYQLRTEYRDTDYANPSGLAIIEARTFDKAGLGRTELDAVAVNVYWHAPENGDEPYLVVDVLTADGTEFCDEHGVPTNVKVVVNDGEVFWNREDS